MNQPNPDNPSSRGLLIIASLSAVVTVLLAGRMPPAMASFRDMFTSFGVTPPSTATFVMDHANAWWVLAIASVATLFWIATRSRPDAAERRRMKLTLSALIALTVLAYGFVAYAIYTPIFKFGAVV